MRHKPLQHIEIIFTFILSPANNHYLSHSSSFNSLHQFTFCFLTTSPPQLCERSAHYSKPAAKHFPRPRRRRRMALVSPCPLGDVQHPTYPKLTFKIRKSVKCDNPESCCAPTVKECLSLLSFPPTTLNPGKLPHPKVFKGHLLWMDTKWEEKSGNLFLSCWSWIILWQSLSRRPSEYSSPVAAGCESQLLELQQNKVQMFNYCNVFQASDIIEGIAQGNFQNHHFFGKCIYNSPNLHLVPSQNWFVLFWYNLSFFFSKKNCV